MNSPLRGRMVLPAEALRAAADGGVEITQAEPPSMFNGWLLDMQVIADGSRAIREHKMHGCVQDMQRCFDERSVASLKAAIDATDAAATDLQLALSVLRSNIRRFEHVIAVHQSRRPRA